MYGNGFLFRLNDIPNHPSRNIIVELVLKMKYAGKCNSKPRERNPNAHSIFSRLGLDLGRFGLLPKREQRWKILCFIVLGISIGKESRKGNLGLCSEEDIKQGLAMVPTSSL
ncbi:hypothetical protein Bhyg_13490 [Pseudolycoriella hygida]|uniref:Uncharacterized protein n=1 Tax=Pseudolycoriella hygida TaxID=35572 RepID=A0A9Q0MQ84_9DIPT|nr:hypothetical protein Bhyg_13490 [Pseudolycoriella hygida]